MVFASDGSCCLPLIGEGARQDSASLILPNVFYISCVSSVSMATVRRFIWLALSLYTSVKNEATLATERDGGSIDALIR